MTTASVLVLAVVVAIAALLAPDIPISIAVFICAAALLISRGAFVICGAALLAAALSANAWSALDRPLPANVNAVATVVRDPERINGAVRADVSINDRRYQVWARGDAASTLARESVGAHVRIEGSVEQLSGKTLPSLRRRHVAGRIDAQSVTHVDNGNAIATTANNLRALIARGTTSMSDANGALYTGLVFGDDRAQSETRREEFRDAGLSHLLAVSGQNVAFLLLVMQPLIKHLSLRWRFIVCGGALFLFATVTRWEPSVVRAVVMAAVVLTATTVGRTSTSWRTLGIAVTIAILLDPFLVGSLGFLLSVTACCGMAAFGTPIASRLAGPQALRNALGFTLAAQLGVAPVQLAVFGPMPIAALPANLLGGPLAAFVMMWGMTAGLFAGFIGEPLSGLMQRPVDAALSALGWVAKTCAGLPIGDWQLSGAALVIAGLLLLPVRHHGPQLEIRSGE